MTKDLADRMTLNQLRLHEWLTDADKQPLPAQPVVKVELTAEDIEQAISNRKAIAIGSAAGPSYLGTASGNATSGWQREGANIIKKRGTLAEADFYVAVLPSTPQTRGLLDGGALAPCAPKKPTLINCGRGDLLSEQSIISALDGGQLSHYVGDVFAPEPLDAASPLWRHPEVTVTPHNSAVTQPSDVAAAFEANLARYEAGGVDALEHVFNWESGY